MSRIPWRTGTKSPTMPRATRPQPNTSPNARPSQEEVGSGPSLPGPPPGGTGRGPSSVTAGFPRPPQVAAEAREHGVELPPRGQ